LARRRSGTDAGILRRPARRAWVDGRSSRPVSLAGGRALAALSL